MNSYLPAQKVAIPSIGWIKVTRLTLGISLQQLAKRLKVAKQSVQQAEKREQEHLISVKSLREAADALDMKLVYGFVPKDGTLDVLIERKSNKLAMQIVGRTAQSMALEDQKNTKKRLKQAIKERAVLLQHELPKLLWD